MATGSQLSQRAWIGKRAFQSRGKKKAKTHQKKQLKWLVVIKFLPVSSVEFWSNVELESRRFQSGSASPSVGWYLASECCDLKNAPWGAAAGAGGARGSLGSLSPRAWSCSPAAVPSLQAEQSCSISSGSQPLV